MDTVNHSMHGAIMAKTLEISFNIDFAIYLLFFSAIIGALPDLLGGLEKIYKKDKSAWNWYLKAHKIDNSNILMYFPPSALHIWLDSFCHEEGKRWWKWNERLWMEVLSWIITITLIILLYGNA